MFTPMKKSMLHIINSKELKQLFYKILPSRSLLPRRPRLG